MRKITFLATAAMMLLPATMNATSWTREVATKDEFTAAIEAIGAGVAGETYEIVLTNDVAEPIKTGNMNINIMTGHLIIRSNIADYDQMPILQTGFSWATDLTSGEMGQQFALVVENVNLQFRGGNTATSGQVVYFSERDAPCDTIAFRNCEITNIPRTLFRSVPKKNATTYPVLDVLELTNCRVHDINIQPGNNWFTLVVGQMVNTVTIKDNIFYNMPYSKGVWQMSRVKDTGSLPVVTFENNTVMLASNKSMASAGYQVMAPVDCLGQGATYYINNNIFLAPQMGAEGLTLKNDTTDYDGEAMILNSTGGIVMASNNVIDPLSYQGWAADNYNAEKGEEKWTHAQTENDIAPETVGLTDWTTGSVFQDASNSLYYMLKSSAAYTAGVGGTYLGSANTYVDAFPQVANVNITINGPKYITYTISPEKDLYYVNDEITITLNDHNSEYRTFNLFNGWEDGTVELERTVTLTGNLNATASFTESDGIVAAFDFSEITRNSSMQSYDADIYFNMDPAYQAVVKGYVNDTATANSAPFPIIEGNFQTRPAKFGEDEENLQMAVISRRTAAIAKESARDYVVVEFSTVKMSDIEFSCFVGTDNNAAKTQALDWSLDGTTWTRLASVDIENGVWSPLAAKLPADAAGKEKVYVKIYGDLANGHVITTDPSGGLVDDAGNEDAAAYAAADAFEYVGNILITADTSTGIVELKGNEKPESANETIVNMLGVEVANPTKGVFIKGGRAYILK